MLGEFFGFVVGGGDAHPFEVLAEGALRLADAHAVVVENDKQLAFEGAGIVSPSKASPLTMEASPTRATTCRGLRHQHRPARAIPTAVLMAVPACPTAKRS